MPPLLTEEEMDIMDSGDESDYDFISSVLACTSQPYSEAMAMHPAVTYTPCDASLRG